MTQNRLRCWAEDGWLMISDAEPGTHVPRETERWIASEDTLEVRR